MVLGNMQLGVLRKLKEQGPMKSGLHPTVHSLARAGFVNLDEEGFSITETGQLALIGYDEMTEFHRQILMQVNRAIANKELYNSDAFKNRAEKDAFDDLLVWDMVDVDDSGSISLLENGRILWEVWTQAHALRDDTKQGNFDAANEKQREKKQKREAAAPPKEIVHEIVRDETALLEDVSPPSPPIFALDGSQMIATIVTPPITETEDCPDCGACIHAEVLDLIAAKYPKVAELRDTLLHQKQLLKELGL